MNTVTVSPKYQVVIPSEIRGHMGLRPGEKLAMHEKDGCVHIVRLKDVRKLRGSLRGLKKGGLRDEKERY